METTFNRAIRISSLVLGFASLTLAAGVQAQTSTTARSDSGYSLFSPGTSYIGLNAGQANFKLNNGLGGFPAEQRRNSYSLYGGSYLNNLGAEIGYTNFGRVTRAGGSTKAEGFNLGVVGKLPVTQALNVIGRIGTTYGRTNVSAAPASGIVSGKQNGFGLSYGVGAEYVFLPNVSAVLQYDEYNLKFANTGRERINSASLGLRYRF